jgi:xanthine dehydrogenase accessory factor
VVSEVIVAVRRLVEEERLGAVVTVVSGPHSGWRAVIDAEVGVVAGGLPSELDEEVHRDARPLMRKEESRTLDYGDHEVFIETIAPAPHMIVFGAVHIAESLASIAKMTGFRVTITDPRPAFAVADRFPDADEILTGWPDELLDQITLGKRVYAVLLSHNPRFEDPLLPVLLNSEVRYIGAMGSRGTHRARVERLLAQGFSEEQVARIHGPIGLDIGAANPPETAIAIMAEVIAERRGLEDPSPS